MSHQSDSSLLDIYSYLSHAASLTNGIVSGRRPTLFFQFSTKIISSTIIFLRFSTKFKQQSDPNIGLQSGCKNLSCNSLAKFFILSVKMYKVWLSWTVLVSQKWNSLHFSVTPVLNLQHFKNLLFSLSISIDVNSLYLFLHSTIHSLLFPAFTAAIMSPSPTTGFDRTFCIRMKSTLTKRGVHVKCSGYRVRISYSKCLRIK